MTKLISECIFKKSFARFGHNVLIRNETSHTLITKSELISIKELKERGVTLEVPINVCQKGHNLTLFFLQLNSNTVGVLPDFGHFKEAFFEAIVKVESIEKNESKENSVFIDVQFTQYDLGEWTKLLNLYAKNQEDINKMIMHQHEIREDE
ncbi:MAG: hypothetical protein H7281_00350 [Bacteriovorax sp.]|nr:hypothetical protein [Bacteriovorax sp.]